MPSIKMRDFRDWYPSNKPNDDILTECLKTENQQRPKWGTRRTKSALPTPEFETRRHKKETLVENVEFLRTCTEQSKRSLVRSECSKLLEGRTTPSGAYIPSPHRSRAQRQETTQWARIFSQAMRLPIELLELQRAAKIAPFPLARSGITRR